MGDGAQAMVDSISRRRRARRDGKAVVAKSDLVAEAVISAAKKHSATSS